MWAGHRETVGHSNMPGASQGGVVVTPDLKKEVGGLFFVTLKEKVVQRAAESNGLLV